jgi:hypothetical protein
VVVVAAGDDLAAGVVIPVVLVVELAVGAGGPGPAPVAPAA